MKLRKIRLWVFSIIGYTVIFALAAAAVFVVVSGANGKASFIGDYTIMWVETPSMYPTIPENSYILVKKAAPSEVESDDVIVFVSDDPSIAGARVVHRVLRVVEDANGARSFITKGDNPQTNPKEDDYPAAGEKLLGKYVRVFSFLSVMGRLLSNTLGFFIIIVLIISILMLIYVPEITAMVKRTDELKIDKEKMMDELVRLEVEKLKASGGLPGIEKPTTPDSEAPKANEENANDAS